MTPALDVRRLDVLASPRNSHRQPARAPETNRRQQARGRAERDGPRPLRRATTEPPRPHPRAPNRHRPANRRTQPRRRYRPGGRAQSGTRSFLFSFGRRAFRASPACIGYGLRGQLPQERGKRILAARCSRGAQIAEEGPGCRAGDGHRTADLRRGPLCTGGWKGCNVDCSMLRAAARCRRGVRLRASYG